MREPDLTAKLLAVQEEFGEIEIRVALEEGDPEQALDELGIDKDWFVQGVLDIAGQYQTVRELSASDVPPPKPDEDHLHAAVIGEAKLYAPSDIPEHISVDVHQGDGERETVFLGKDVTEVEAQEKAA